jgi:hypothetical protein
MNNIVFLALFSFVINFATSAQQQSMHIGGTLTLPPSPTPNNLINQIDQKINYYTGALNFTIPIHTVKSKTIEWPISLNYNGSGVKINDLGSWVGLGWSLNAGGVVARVMHGLPDEFDGEIRVGDRNVPGKGWLNPVVRGNSSQEILDFFVGTTGNNRVNTIEFANKTGNYVYGGANPQAWDTEPDEFYFNFGRHSGKFIFDKNGGVRIIPAQNLTVRNIVTTPASTLGSTNSKEITSMEIVDETGTVYTFGNKVVSSSSSLTAVERTFHHFFTQNVLTGRLRLPATIDFQNPETLGSLTIYKWALEPMILIGSIGSTHIESVNASLVANYLPLSSTWHLTKIESPNGNDFLNFNYQNEELLYMTSHDINISQDNLDIYVDNNPAYPETDLYKKKYYGSKFLNSTIDEKGMFSFKVGNDDVNLGIRFYPQNTTISTGFNTVTAKRLSSIVDAIGNQVVLNSNTIRYDLNGGHQLDQLDIINSIGKNVKSLKFNYGYTEAAPYNANGELDIEYDQFIYWFTANTQNGFWPITEWGLDANDPQGDPYIAAWKEIWEAAVACDYRRLFLQDIKESGDNWATSEELYSFDYDFNEVLPRRLSPKQDSWGYFNANTKGHLIEAFGYNTTWQSGAPVPGSFGQLIPGTSTNFTFPFRATNTIDSNNKPILVDPTFDANRSPVLVKAQCGVLKKIYFPTGGKKEFTYQLNTKGSVPVGGLRISFIDDYPDKNLGSFERTILQYYEGASPYSDIIQGEVWDIDPIDTKSIRNQLTVSSSPMNFTPNTKGGVVGYGKVEEFREGQGKKIFYFKNPTSDPDSYLSTLDINGSACSLCPAYSPPVDNDFSRGLLWKTEILNHQGQVLKRDITNYQINPPGFTPNTTYALKPGVRFQFNSVNPIEDRKQFAGFYAYNQKFISILSQTSEIYDQSFPGDETKKIVTNLFYDYKLPGVTPETISVDLQPRRIWQSFSNGEKLVTATRYASDYSAASSVSDITVNGIYLLNQKKIVTPIETINYLERTEGATVTNYLLGGALLKFKEFSNHPGKVYSSEQFKLKPGNTSFVGNYNWSTINGGQFSWPNSQLFKLTRSISSYDSYGNPNALFGEDGVPFSYTWSHNGSLIGSATQNPGTTEQQTSYTYETLVGVTQIRDANMQDSKFNYDNFNRLKLTLDHSNNILSRYRYHRKDELDNKIDFGFLSYSSTPTSNTIQFVSKGTGQPGTSLIWDFGAGTVKENGLNSELYTYTAPGYYTVKLASKHAEYPTQVTSKTIRIIPTATAHFTLPVTGSTYTVCGPATVNCSVSIADGPYATYQWEHNYSGSGSGAWLPVGANSSTLNFTHSGVQSSSSSLRCKVTDAAGNSRYSNTINIFYYCSGQPGPSDCPPEYTWNSQLGRCEPPQGSCGEGCFWDGFQCVCY